MSDEFISRTATFYSLAVVVDSRLPKSDQMTLERAVVVELADFRRVRIPAGFLTDCHSTPPWSQSLLPAYNNRTNLAAIVHDYLYMEWEHFVAIYPELAGADARAYSDEVYQELMERFGGKGLRNWLYVLAVRTFGGINWRKFRNEANL
ncbi:hypothetical protein GCM10028807_17340 [Spirosoma daeguense]